MTQSVHYSSVKDDWETPQDFFDTLNDQYHFTLDPCASHDNAKCKRYYTIVENGLLQSWNNERVFCNPPYGRQIKQWVKKASESKALTVMLIPARTDTSYFHEFIYHKANITFIKGRLKFSGCKNSAPFPSMIVVFDNRRVS